VSLFEPDLPAGFSYCDAFISEGDEKFLLNEITSIEFSTFVMRGVTARRRVAFFGRSYDADAAPVREMPAFLFGLRDQLAQWANLAPEAFVMALINEYPAGAPVGWHRDAPQYGIVAGVSLLSPARMKFRPIEVRSAEAVALRRRATHEIVLARRSAYLMTGASRQDYEHHVPPVMSLRYSITFRTARAPSTPLRAG
jgi:hypothetical protein